MNRSPLLNIISKRFRSTKTDWFSITTAIVYIFKNSSNPLDEAKQTTTTINDYNILKTTVVHSPNDLVVALVT